MSKATNDSERRDLANMYFMCKISTHVEKGYKKYKKYRDRAPYTFSLTGYYADRLEKKANAVRDKLEPAGQKAMCSALANFPVEKAVGKAFENAAALCRAATVGDSWPY